VKNAWAIVVLLNAVIFALYLRRQRYSRLWLAVVAALLIGPLIWIWWGFLVWRDNRQVGAD
jgi:hypothetical protein